MTKLLVETCQKGVFNSERTATKSDSQSREGVGFENKCPRDLFVGIQAFD